MQTITPVVHGGRRSRWGASVAAHAVGATASSGALGAARGAAGRGRGAPWGATGLVLVTGLAVLYAAREASALPVPVPELRRQVPEWWRSSFSPPVASLLYGIGLGVGFATHLRHGTFVVVGAAALASGDPAVGAALLAPFGLARALTVATAMGSTTAERVARASERLERWAMGAAPRLANGAVLVAVVAGAVVVLSSGSVAREGSSGMAPFVVASVLAWAAMAKALRFRAWRDSLGAHGIEGPVAGAVSFAVPTAEAATVALFVVDVRVGAATAIALLVAFTLALLRASRISGRRLPCGCFGRTKTRDVGLLVGRNVLLIGLSALMLA
ncbi:MAG TPA: MauE/DoxX family redox-associated membrane protein [Actinomycetota bacterium]|nr:MauE/DoxX family redox-associated membrane protein [Actinomycetota bacterium]